MLSLPLAAVLHVASLPVGIEADPNLVPEARPDLRIGDRKYRRIERRANDYTSSSQDAAALDVDAFGRAVVVWQSRRQEEGTYGIFARRFGPDGASLGEEVHVNATTRSQQMNPAVAVDATGAWFAWESFGQDGDQGSIVARRFDAMLSSSGAEVLVNESSAEGHQEAPFVAADGRGGAIVAWTTPGASPGERWILARRFSADGGAFGPAFRVDVAPDARDSIPSLGLLPDKSLVAAWARARLDGRPAGIFARRFSLDGAPLSAETEISPRDGGMHIEPVLATGADGRFALAWFHAPKEGPGSGSYGALLRLARPGASGLELEPARSMDLGITGQDLYANGLALSSAADGRWLLAWNRCGDREAESDLCAQLLAADAAQSGEPFQVGAKSAGHQRMAAASGVVHAVLEADGRMLFAWSGDAELGDETGAHLTLLAPEELDLSALAREAPEPVQVAVAVPAAGREARSADAAGGGASPEHHVPPTYDPPARMERADIPQDLLNNAGPDYGFVGVVNTGWTPPDPHIAVGPNHVVLMTNGRIQFMQKTGVLDFSADIVGSGGFWGAQGAGGFVFDPEAHYDLASGRFFAMACERFNGVTSHFLLGVSDDSDPNGTWHKYRFDVTALAGNDIDSPELAVDSQAVYLTADFFGPDTFLVYIVDKAAVLAGGAPLTRSLLITGSQSYGVPMTYGTPPAQYMIQALEAASNTQLILHAVQNPLTTPTDTTFTLNVPTYTRPEDPPQMGTAVRPEVFEARFWNCMYRNGYLWATHHTGTSRVVQRWYQIDMANWPVSGTPTVVQQGDIDIGPTIRTFFGSIWADGANNAAMTFSRSSPTEFISVARCFRRASDPLGTMTAAVTIQPSTSPETSGRWGDYSNVADDPLVPGAFWGHNEFRTSSWMTWVGLFGPDQPPVNYCTGKMNSIGQTPFISAAGEPSVGIGNFTLELNNALPNRLSVVFYSDNPDSTPYQNGTRCVLPPLTRGGTFTTNGIGYGSTGHAIPFANLGKSRYFQIFSRDGMNPDGTGLSLTDGLSVVFGP